MEPHWFWQPSPSSLEKARTFQNGCHGIVDMGVSLNGATPKSSILIGVFIINHPFWGTPIFGSTHIVGRNSIGGEAKQKQQLYTPLLCILFCCGMYFWKKEMCLWYTRYGFLVCSRWFWLDLMVFWLGDCFVVDTTMDNGGPDGLGILSHIICKICVKIRCSGKVRSWTVLPWCMHEATKPMYIKRKGWSKWVCVWVSGYGSKIDCHSNRPTNMMLLILVFPPEEW